MTLGDGGAADEVLMAAVLMWRIVGPDDDGFEVDSELFAKETLVMPNKMVEAHIVHGVVGLLAWGNRFGKEMVSVAGTDLDIFERRFGLIIIVLAFLFHFRRPPIIDAYEVINDGVTVD